MIETPADFTNPATYCKAARGAQGVDAFNKQYGTNASKKNAFDKCVSKTASNKAEAHEDAAEANQAAAECKKQKAADPAKFGEQYKNLGQCVKAQTNDCAAADPSLIDLIRSFPSPQGGAYRD